MIIVIDKINRGAYVLSYSNFTKFWKVDFYLSTGSPIGNQQFHSKEEALDNINERIGTTLKDWVRIEKSEISEYIQKHIPLLTNVMAEREESKPNYLVNYKPNYGLQEKLKDYRILVKKYHPELHHNLQPGLSRSNIIELLSQLPFAISPDAIDLYSWANGVKDKSIDLIPISYFMSLEEAIQQFNLLLPFQDEFENIFPQKFRRSFPFLSDHSDGGFGFGSTEDPCNSKIISYDIHSEWSIGFNSLSDLIETAMEGYKCNMINVNGEWDIFAFQKLVSKRYTNLKT